MSDRKKQPPKRGGQRGRGRGQRDWQRRVEKELKDLPALGEEELIDRLRALPVPSNTVPDKPSAPDLHYPSSNGKDEYDPDEGESKQHRLPIKISFALTDSQRHQLSKLYPHHEFVEKRYSTPHVHPFTACERQVAEQVIAHKLEKFDEVVDIGGNPSRHYWADRDNVHCVCPRLEPHADVAAAFRNDKQQACECDPFNCIHHPTPDVYMGSFELIQYSQKQICSLIHNSKKGIIIFPVRRFLDCMGTKNHSEIKYLRTETDVVFSVLGSTVSYKVPDESWIYTANHWTDGTMAMAWDVQQQVGDCDIIAFVKSDPKRDTSKTLPTQLEYDRALVTNTITGPVTLDVRGHLGKDAILVSTSVLERVAQSKCFSIYNWFMFIEVDDKRVYVPKQCLGAVRLFASGKPRDPANFQTVVNKAKEEIRRYQMTPEQMADSCFYIAVLAFFKDIENEVTTLAGALTAMELPVKNLSTLQNFIVPDTWKSTYSVGALILSTAFGAYLLGRRQRLNLSLPHATTVRGNKESIGGVISTFWSMISLVLLSDYNPFRHFIKNVKIMVYRPYRYVMKVFKKHSIKTFSVRFVKNDPNTRIEVHDPIHLPDVCMVSQKLRVMDDSAIVDVSNVDMRCIPSHGSTLFGLGLGIRRPVTARACWHNELVAIVNRGCLPQTQPDVDYYTMTSIVLTNMFPLNVDSQYVSEGVLRPPKFADWLRRFPEGRRRELRAARERMKSGTPANPTCKVFVKREHQLKTQELADEHEYDGVELFDPRLIQSSLPEFQVLTGPTTFAMTKHVAKLWSSEAAFDPTHPAHLARVIYTSGLNAEQLSKAVEDAVAFISDDPDDVHVIETDQKRLDAHCHEKALMLKNKPYEWLRVKPTVRRAICRTGVILAHSRHGIVFQVADTVRSGRGDTSVGDTIISGSGTRTSAKIAGIPPNKYVILAVGDDIYILVHKLYGKALAEQLLQYWGRMGFEVDLVYVTKIRDGEYISGRFYAIQGGLMFGPKIGRVLAKTFYSQKNDLNNHQGMRWLRAVALGLSKDVNHIPILRVVVRRILVLTQDYTPRKLPYEPEKVHAEEYHEASDETFEQCAVIYHCSPSDLYALEDFIEKNFVAVPATLYHPLLENITKYDIDGLPRVSEIPVSIGALPLVPALFAVITPLYTYSFFLIRKLKHPLDFVIIGAIVLNPSLWNVGVVDFDRAVFTPIFEEFAKSHGGWRYTAFLMVAETVIFASSYGIENTYVYSMWWLLHPALCLLTHVLKPSYPNAWLLSASLHSMMNGYMFTAPSGKLDGHFLVLSWNMFIAPFVNTLNFFTIPVCTGIASIVSGTCTIIYTPVTLVSYCWSMTHQQANKLIKMVTGNGTENNKGRYLEMCTKTGAVYPICELTPKMVGSVAQYVATLKRDGQVLGEGMALKKKDAEQLAYKEALQRFERVEVKKAEGPIDKLRIETQRILTWDCIAIDGDQIHPPCVGLMGMRAESTIISGNPQNLPAWQNYLKERPSNLGDIYLAPVAATFNAADMLLLQCIKEKTRNSILATGDKRLAKIVEELGAVVVTNLDTPHHNYANLALTHEYVKLILDATGLSPPSSPGGLIKL